MGVGKWTSSQGAAPPLWAGLRCSATVEGCPRWLPGAREPGEDPLVSPRACLMGWPVGLAALPGAQFCVWCHFPLSQPGSHAPQSSLQPGSIIATPKSGVANGPRRVERWVALLRGMFPPSAAAAHHCLLPPQRRTSTRGLTAGTRSRPPESRGGVRALDSPLVDLDEAHHRGRRHRSRASASLRACFIPPCCRRGRSRLTTARGGGGREWRGASGGGGCAGEEELVGGGAASCIATAGDLHRHAKAPVGQVVQVLDELELELSGSHGRGGVCP
jgi:hypothetical protein